MYIVRCVANGYNSMLYIIRAMAFNGGRNLECNCVASIVVSKEGEVKVIYVAGKYRANSEWGLVENIRHAEAVAIKLWQQGWAVICPHKNTAFFGGLAPDIRWLEGDLEMIKRCDAICLIKGWRDSVGSVEEYHLAKKLGLKIYYETRGLDGIQ